MTQLRISPTLSLPLDWMTLASVVYGARGSGKTHFGAVIAEAVTKEHQRFCAIDLKGDWWGLKAGAHANPPVSPASTTALHDMVREQLDGPRRSILDVLLDEYPNALTHEELGQRTGYSPGGGYWRSLVGKLSTLGLITYPVRGCVAAAPVLFLEQT